MNEMNETNSLRDRMKAAGSVEEVNSLLAEGLGYRLATQNTRNKMRRDALRRIAILTKGESR
jgi:hypothetical protein